MRLKIVVVALGAAFLLLSGFRPGTLPYTPGQPFSDAVTSHLPAAQFFRESLLENGTFPLWRETIMAGQPFAADPLNKTAYPFQWLVLLILPVYHLDLLIVLHLLIAGAGMWVWARALGLREEAAALSALAYALAPRVIGHLGAGHLDLLYALAWFPWLIWSVGELIHQDRRSLRGIASAEDVALSDPRLSRPFSGRPFPLAEGLNPRRQMLLVGLFGALILLADVRLSLFAYTLGGAYVLYEAIRLHQIRRLLRFIPPALLILLLTLSLTLPLLAWRPYLSRAALTSADSGVFSLTPAQFLGLILPISGGNIETLTYLGLPVLVLAIIGALTATARRWFWLAAVAIAALYALGINAPLWTTLTNIVPALLWFRVPSRAWFVVALIAPLLAGYGAQWLIDQRARRGVRIVLIGTVAALVSGFFFMVSVPAVNGLAILIGGGGVGIVILLALGGRLRGERLAWALIAVTFLDLALSGRGWLEWRIQEAWLPPDQVQLAQRLTELGAYRVYSPTYSLQQQVAEEYHLRLFGGIDPFQLNGIVTAVEQGGGITSSGYSVVLPPLDSSVLELANQNALPDTAVLGRWGVTHVVSAYPLGVPNLVQVDVVAGVYIYANRDPALTTGTVATAFGAIPAWSPGWADLPDAPTVAALNQRTGAAALISAVSLIGLLALLGVTKVRH